MLQLIKFPPRFCCRFHFVSFIFLSASLFSVSCRSFEINLQMIYYVQRVEEGRQVRGGKKEQRSRGGSCAYDNGKWKPLLTLMNAAVYCFAVRFDQIRFGASNCRWTGKFASYATALCAHLWPPSGGNRNGNYFQIDCKSHPDFAGFAIRFIGSLIN